MDNFRSASKIRYTKLNELLEAKKWKEANNETAYVMLEVAGKAAKKETIKLDELEKFPCEDLDKINRLWLLHSSERFGFSVQQSIWLDFQEDPEPYLRFCERLGWWANDNWLNEWLCEDSTAPLSLPVPNGYLPRLWDFPAFNNVSPYHAEQLFSRLKTCGL